MLRLSNTEKNGGMERKPWDLYASGDFKAHLQSPFRHAQQVQATDSACASAIVNIEDCSSWETLKTSLKNTLGEAEQPDLCWVEIEPPNVTAARYNDFVSQHDRWMDEQLTYCKQVDAFLQQIRDEILSKGTLLLALPQGDLSLLRYLKGLRTRSKWRDSTSNNDDPPLEELQIAVGDAFRGAMDSCLFLTQKKSLE